MSFKQGNIREAYQVNLIPSVCKLLVCSCLFCASKTYHLNHTSNGLNSSEEAIVPKCPCFLGYSIIFFLKFGLIMKDLGDFLYPYQTTMGSMVGRIINRFAERGKVFPNCGPATMEQRVTLVSCKDKDRDKK